MRICFFFVFFNIYTQLRWETLLFAFTKPNRAPVFPLLCDMFQPNWTVWQFKNLACVLLDGKTTWFRHFVHFWSFLAKSRQFRRRRYSAKDLSTLLAFVRDAVRLISRAAPLDRYHYNVICVKRLSFCCVSLRTERQCVMCALSWRGFDPSMSWWGLCTNNIRLRLNAGYAGISLFALACYSGHSHLNFC